MSLRVTPFQPFDLQLLIAQGVQSAQERSVSIMPAGYATTLKPPGPCVTAWAGDRIIVCGGIFDVGERLGLLWAVLSPEAGAHLLRIHRGVERLIELAAKPRLEATVELGFIQGCRWLELFGFRREGEMPGYGGRGETHIRYGRYVGAG